MWRRKKGLLASPGEKDSSTQGPARGRRVCSFIGVGFPWPLRSPVYESSEKRKEVALGRVGEEEVTDVGEGDVGLQRSPSWRDEGRRGSRSVRVSSAKER